MDYTIHDLPEADRPREKLRDHGAAALTDTELLAILLRTGTQGKNVKELSAEILNTYSLAQMGQRSLQDLQRFDGVSEVKAGQLQAIGELATRLQKQDRDTVSSLQDVEARVADMRYLESEELRVLHLSNGNELLHEETIDGSVDAVDVTARTVFRDALRHNAAALILAHNHPSGDATPTDTDVATTRDLVETGQRLGVTVLDHVIVADTVTSLRQEQPGLFETGT